MFNFTQSKKNTLEGGRFLLLGVLNTFLTFLLYQFLLLFTPPGISYTLSYVAGIAFVSFCYPKYVFRVANFRFSIFAGTFIYYVISYLLGLMLLSLFNTQLGLNPRLSIVFVVTIMLPVNFIATRFVSFYFSTSRNG